MRNALIAASATGPNPPLRNCTCGQASRCNCPAGVNAKPLPLMQQKNSAPKRAKVAGRKIKK
jgi:hypothetical protein